MKCIHPYKLCEQCARHPPKQANDPFLITIIEVYSPYKSFDAYQHYIVTYNFKKFNIYNSKQQLINTFSPNRYDNEYKRLPETVKTEIYRKQNYYDTLITDVGKKIVLLKQFNLVNDVLQTIYKQYVDMVMNEFSIYERKVCYIAACGN